MKKKYCVLCECPNLNLISSYVRDSENHKVIQCLKCGHVQLYPIPSAQDYKKFYDKEMQNSVLKIKIPLSKLRKLNEHDVKRRVSLIRKLIPQNKRILEIGSGDGFFFRKH